MKCPSCAEDIQDEAKKCRFCGEILTKAAKRGYPAFYENVTSWGGLSFQALCMDYGYFLYPQDGFSDSCVGASYPVSCLFLSSGDEEEQARFNEKAKRFIQAMGERLGDIAGESQEALVLRAMIKYFKIARDYSSNRDGDRTCDPKILKYSIGALTDLRQTLPPIETQSRAELESQIDSAIKTCQERLRDLPASKSSALSTVPAAAKSGSSGCMILLIVLFISTTACVAAKLYF